MRDADEQDCRNQQNEQRIKMECGRNFPVQEAVRGPQAPAPWALPSRQRVEKATRVEGVLVRRKEKKQAQRARKTEQARPR